MPLPDSLGKYKIQRELGRGAMGVVYRGFDPFIEREVAIKTLRADAVDAKEKAVLLERFQKEAKAAGRMNHPNIVQIYEYGEDADQVYIAMEIVQGVELRDYLEEGSKFSMESIVSMMQELLEALGFAHKHGVVHRDIKPGNIVVLPDGHIKIMDFGIARLESSTLTQAGTILGTPSYMSPEQFMGQRVDGRSDLFSAGVILYELLTGEKAFPGNAFSTIMHKVLKEDPPPPSELNVLVTREFDQVVKKALGKRPSERFQNAAEFSESLRRALAGETPFAAPAPAADATVMMSDGTVVMSEATVMMGAAPAASPPPPPPSAEATMMAAPPSPASGAGARPAAMDWTEVIPPAQRGEPPGAPAAASAPVAAPVTPPAQPASKTPLIAGGVAVALVAIALAVFMGGESSAPRQEPATAAAAKQVGWIKVESDPVGAVLVIDNGGFGGVAPTRLELPPGPHQVRARKDGFQDWEATIEIEAGQELPLNLTLSPAQ